MKKVLALVLVLVLSLSVLTACAQKEVKNSFEGKNTRVVIGSTATTGDSYMIADMTMRYLAKELKANTKVDAVGAGPAFEAISTAKPDGETIMMFHDMTYLGVLFGAFDPKYALENMVVGPRVGVNPGAAFGAKGNAPYNDMREMAEYLKANPTETVRVAIEAGGVSHIGFIGYYEWLVNQYGKDVADRVKVIVGGSTGEKLQMLWDGNTDVIFADYSSLLQYTDPKVEDKLRVKFVALLDEIDGVNTPTFADLGVTLNGKPFVFSKDFIIYLPKDTPAEYVAELDKAAEAVANDPAFQAEMAKLQYRAAYMPAAEAKTYITEKRDSLEALIKAAPSLDELTVK
jgi:tripartite-type tricarboxylate transporter receptor subunit TctC